VHAAAADRSVDAAAVLQQDEAADRGQGEGVGGLERALLLLELHPDRLVQVATVVRELDLGALAGEHIGLEPIGLGPMGELQHELEVTCRQALQLERPRARVDARSRDVWRGLPGWI
jgi:hypothetical protein